MTETTLAPVPEAAEGMFPQLLAGLREFRARVEGHDVASSGRYRTRMLDLHGQTGLVPDIVEFVLAALREILGFIYAAVDRVESFVGASDAMLALIETLGHGLSALGHALSSGVPTGLASKAGPVTDGLVAVGGVLGDVKLPNIIPSPSTLAAIRVEIRGLLGTEVDPEANPPIGSLTAVLNALVAA